MKTNAYPSSGGAGVLLFDEDFDLPPPSLEPEVIEPLYTAAEMHAAREAATQDGRESARDEADASTRAASARALTLIATHIEETRAATISVAEQSAEAIARLLMDCFAAVFPALCERLGPAEVAAVVRTILPAVEREPKVLVKINPSLAAGVTAELAAMDPDIVANVRLVPTDAVAPGDIRINWQHGSAIRNTAALWRQIEGVLAPAGLLNAKETAKEHELVE